MIYTTLRIIRDNDACVDGYKTLRAALPHRFGMDEPIPLALALCSNGLQDTLWGLSFVHPDCEQERDRVARLFACECAERVLPLFEREFPHDDRPRSAIRVARLFAAGDASAEELDAAWAAGDAARDAWAAAGAAGDAGDAARAAGGAAGGAAWAAWAAAGDAAWAAWAAARAAGDAAWAAWAAGDAARDARAAAGAAGAAGDAEKKAQSEILHRLLCNL